MASALTSPYTNTIVFGGNAPPAVDNVETWNGSSWTETTDMSIARKEFGGAGSSSTNALAFGGETPLTPASGPHSVKTESWNGSSWTEGGDLNEARRGQSGAGTNTLALCIGGNPDPAYTGKTEQWDGSSWTEVNDLNTARSQGGSAGIYNNCLYMGGVSPYKANVETWDGTSWTEQDDLSAIRATMGGGGTIASAFAGGGRGPGSSPQYINVTEEWSAPATFVQIQEGQLFFNSTVNAFKETISDIPGGTWASNANMNNARDNTSGTGHTKDAVMIMAGRGPSSNIGNCEQWNGSTWTEVADVTSRRMSAGSGTSTAALQFGGTTSYPTSPPGQSALTESFNGSTWTEVGDLNTARWRVSGSPSGTSTAALAIGGREPSYSAKTEVYNGSTWTEVGDLNAAKAGATNIGTSTANIFAGGETAPGADTANTESWDGTSWTEVNNLPAAAKENGGTGGTSTLGFLAGVGGGAAPTSECDFWNGTSWSEMAELGSGRPAGAGGGTSVGATIAGGNPFTAASESFTAPLANKTITAS
jgi:hypothetical protein